MRFLWFPICMLISFGYVGGSLVAAQDELAVKVLYYQTSGEDFQLDEDGISRGKNGKKVHDFLTGRGVPYTWVIQPWSRLYREVQNASDALVYNLLRIEEREDKFHWLLKIQEQELYLMTRNEAGMRDLTLETILAGEYRAVCDHSSAQCRILEKIGFPEGRILKSPSGVEHSDLAKLVISGRADFMVSNKQELLDEMTEVGLEPDQLFQLFKVYSTATYLAAPKSISAGLLEQLTKE